MGHANKFFCLNYEGALTFMHLPLWQTCKMAPPEGLLQALLPAFILNQAYRATPLTMAPSQLPP